MGVQLQHERPARRVDFWTAKPLITRPLDIGTKGDRTDAGYEDEKRGEEDCRSSEYKPFKHMAVIVRRAYFFEPTLFDLR